MIPLLFEATLTDNRTNSLYSTSSVRVKCLRFSATVHYNLTWTNRFINEFTCLPQPQYSGRPLRNLKDCTGTEKVHYKGIGHVICTVLDCYL